MGQLAHDNDLPETNEQLAERFDDMKTSVHDDIHQTLTRHLEKHDLDALDSYLEERSVDLELLIQRVVMYEIKDYKLYKCLIMRDNGFGYAEHTVKYLIDSMNLDALTMLKFEEMNEKYQDPTDTELEQLRGH